MTSKQVMQQALEALESLQRYDGTLTGAQVATAIESLRGALAQQGGPVAWMHTLEYGAVVADTKVSVRQLNYPFGVCGADYLAKNDDGVSYVRQTPLYKAQSVPDSLLAKLPGGKKTDQWDSARMADYDQGWNDYRKAVKAVLVGAAPAAPSDDKDLLTIAAMDAYQMSKRDALAQPVEPVAKYIGETPYGSHVQLYEDLKKGTELYAGAAPAAQRCDTARVLEWMRTPNRKAAQFAFTEGPERQAAYWIEIAQSEPAAQQMELGEQKPVAWAFKNEYGITLSEGDCTTLPNGVSTPLYAGSAPAVLEAVEKLERDAARYRWLAWRSDTNPIMPYDHKNDRFYIGFECDEAIDAAMEATNGQCD